MATYDFEVIPDEEWEGPEPVELPRMTWYTDQSFPIIQHHLFKNRERLQRPTRRVQKMIGPDSFRTGYPMDLLDQLPLWEAEQFWTWLMPMLYTSNMKQLDQYLAWLRRGSVVSSYRGHMAATDLYVVCKDIVRHRMRKGV